MSCFRAFRAVADSATTRTRPPAMVLRVASVHLDAFEKTMTAKAWHFGQRKPSQFVRRKIIASHFPSWPACASVSKTHCSS